MGEVQAAVARALRVSRQSVSRWYDEWRRGGAAALRGAGRAGRKPRLSEAQLARVDVALREGAQAHGYATDMWTLPRVATVIARLTGVQYHPGHVWRILRALDWSLQRPSTRARERNDAQIQHWVTTRWPAVKKTPAICHCIIRDSLGPTCHSHPCFVQGSDVPPLPPLPPSGVGCKCARVSAALSVRDAGTGCLKKPRTIIEHSSNPEEHQGRT